MNAVTARAVPAMKKSAPAISLNVISVVAARTLAFIPIAIN
jgi:hypothetical protein